MRFLFAFCEVAGRSVSGNYGGQVGFVGIMSGNEFWPKKRGWADKMVEWFAKRYGASVRSLGVCVKTAADVVVNFGNFERAAARCALV